MGRIISITKLCRHCFLFFFFLNPCWQYWPDFSKGTELIEWCILRWGALDWLAGCCSFSSPAMAVSHRRGQEHGSCSFHEAGCSISLHLMLNAWRIRGELPVFSLYWNSKELVLISLKDCHNNTSDEPAGDGEGNQTESKVSFFCALHLRCHQKVPPTFRVGLSTSNNLILRLLHRNA